MALDFHDTSPVSSHTRSLSPRSYSFAAEHALSEKEPSVEELEAAVKETPPRPASTSINGHVRHSSEHRSLDDVMDEGDNMLPPGSPSLRHTKGRIEDNVRSKSSASNYSNMSKHESSDTLSTHGMLDDQQAFTNRRATPSIKEEPDTSEESYASVVKHEGPNDGERRVHASWGPIGGRKSPAVAARSASNAEDKPVAEISEQNSLSHHNESYSRIPEHSTHHQDVKPAEIKQEEKDAQPKLADVLKHEPTADIGDSHADVVKHEPVHSIDSHANAVKPESVSSGNYHTSTTKHDLVDSVHSPAGVVKRKPVGSGDSYSSKIKRESVGSRDSHTNVVNNEPVDSGDSYANVVKHEPTSPILHPLTPPSSQDPSGSVDLQGQTSTQHERYPSPSSSADRQPNGSPQISSEAQDKAQKDRHAAANYDGTYSDTPQSQSQAADGAENTHDAIPNDDRTQSEKQRNHSQVVNEPEQTHTGTEPETAPNKSEELGSAEGNHNVAPTSTTQQISDTDNKVGTLVYENYESRSGTNLASVALGQEYDLALSQRENKQISSEPHDEKTANDHSGSTLVSGRRAGAGWSRSAVRWAPRNVPLQRRLQTLALLIHSLSIASFVAFFFFLCAIPVFWPILIPYLIYVLLSRAATDGKLAHRSEYLRRSKFWSLFASYFPARLHRTTELQPTRKYIFGYHPHGIISHGAFAAFTTEALGFSSLFPGITNTLLTLDSNFRIPLYRDWALRLGLASVSRESCENLLSRGGRNGEGMGRAITIVVGGARESLDAKPGTLNLVLAKRKGFVKLAVRTGADLVPVLAFGENDMYEQIDSDTHPRIHKGQLLLKRFMGFTVPLFHARGVFNYDVGILPYRRPINIVVGRPIPTIQAKRPDPAYIDDLHKQYTDELLHIWSEWKDTFAPDRQAELRIIE